MKQKNLPQFSWDEETGEATCILTSKNGAVFYATANCHPDDIDFMSEKTGCEIAYRRAAIKMLQFYRDNTVKPGLAALKQLIYSINKSKEYDPTSYEARMIYRQYKEKLEDLEAVKQLIAERRLELFDMINAKDKFYKMTRAHRKEKELEEANSK